MYVDKIKNEDERLGALYRGSADTPGSCDFLVWAPRARRVELDVIAPQAQRHSMAPCGDGYFALTLERVAAQSLYRFTLFQQTGAKRQDASLQRADPASRFQPQGVHGPSQIVADGFPWRDTGWNGPRLEDYIIYELHVGTATPEGTFEALIPLLPVLRDFGITALELMPVAEFPGERNWGYDGVCPYAVHHAYGGPTGLKRLVDACHCNGLAVIMDVVYNHLGPEGNYLADFGPYFTHAHTTPWGSAVNLDGPYSDHVRRYFLENARYWISDCHLDALRVDAVHGMFDFSAQPFLSQLTRQVHAHAQQQQRNIYCFAESDLNDTRVIRPVKDGGYGFDAQWNDDFHHALHSLLTGESKGYYADFGSLDHLAKAWQCGFVYDGRYSVARKRRHGNDARHISPSKFIVFAQNHDQVGNRMHGERLSHLVGLEQTKLAAASVLLSPYIPLLFMGEEYGEPAPFAYFVSHTDPDLVEAVRKGRRDEFSAFGWEDEPPDPQSLQTFRNSKLTRHLSTRPGAHRTLYAFYGELIRLRQSLPALSRLHRGGFSVTLKDTTGLLGVGRKHGRSEVYMLFNFSPEGNDTEAILPPGQWRKKLDTADQYWSGPGSTAPEMVRDDTEAAVSMLPWHMILWERPPSALPPAKDTPQAMVEGEPS